MPDPVMIPIRIGLRWLCRDRRRARGRCGASARRPSSPRPSPRPSPPARRAAARRPVPASRPAQGLPGPGPARAPPSAGRSSGRGDRRGRRHGRGRCCRRPAWAGPAPPGRAAPAASLGRGCVAWRLSLPRRPLPLRCRGRGPGGCRDRRRRRSWRVAGPGRRLLQRRCGRWRCEPLSGCRCCASSDGRAARGIPVVVLARGRGEAPLVEVEVAWRLVCAGVADAVAVGVGSTRPRGRGRRRSGGGGGGGRVAVPWRASPSCATSPRRRGATRAGRAVRGALRDRAPDDRRASGTGAGGTVTRTVVVPETKMRGRGDRC